MAKTTAIVLPDPEDINPEYGALIQKRRELHARKAALAAEESTVWTKVHAGGRAARPTGRDRAVAELLGDAVDDASDEADLQTQLEAVRAEQATVADAIDVLNGRIAIARRGASSAVADAIRTDWTAKYNALVKVLTEAKALADELEAVRYAASLRDVHFQGRLPLLPLQAVSEKIATVLEQADR